MIQELHNKSKHNTTLKSMHANKGATLGSLSPRISSAKSVFFESRTCKELMNEKFNKVTWHFVSFVSFLTVET